MPACTIGVMAPRCKDDDDDDDDGDDDFTGLLFLGLGLMF